MIAAKAPSAQNTLYSSRGSWETDEGRTITLAAFASRPCVIAMFFASCEGTCVLTADHMKRIEASLPADLRDRTRFVLVTVDPAEDTAKSLRAYRAQRQLSEDRWTLLRGDPAATLELADTLGIVLHRSLTRRFTHSPVLTVLDDAGRIVLRQTGTHPDLGLVVATLTRLHGANPPLASLVK